MARTPIDIFIKYELKPLFLDLGILEVDDLVLMPIDYTEILILRSSTGNRPLTPFSRISECARSIVDFWTLKDSGDNRNVFVVKNDDDQTYRSVIPERPSDLVSGHPTLSS
tara:strand:- start:77 stop:409 length:333 start_codon:yes stop_codon:yes gene_type:complete